MATIATFLRIRERFAAYGCRSEYVKWVRVRGNLTSPAAAMDAAGRLRAACSNAVRLIVDTGGVDEADTKFVAVLVDLRRRARAAGAEVVILPSAAVRRWLRICRLEVLVR